VGESFSDRKFLVVEHKQHRNKELDSRVLWHWYMFAFYYLETLLTLAFHELCVYILSENWIQIGRYRDKACIFEVRDKSEYVWKMKS
jgi:hypothetical protein